MEIDQILNLSLAISPSTQQLASTEVAPRVNINCVDRLGNTALHTAAYRDNRAVAIFLLENGIDTTIRNNYGKLASDMAINSAMKDVLGVPPIKALRQTPFRYQGPLFRYMRFRGWRPFWVSFPPNLTIERLFSRSNGPLRPHQRKSPRSEALRQ
jgi:hypothetical protein